MKFCPKIYALSKESSRQTHKTWSKSNTYPNKNEGKGECNLRSWGILRRKAGNMRKRWKNSSIPDSDRYCHQIATEREKRAYLPGPPPPPSVHRRPEKISTPTVAAAAPGPAVRRPPRSCRSYSDQIRQNPLEESVTSTGNHRRRLLPRSDLLHPAQLLRSADPRLHTPPPATPHRNGLREIHGERSWGPDRRSIDRLHGGMTTHSPSSPPSSFALANLPLPPIPYLYHPLTRRKTISPAPGSQ